MLVFFHLEHLFSLKWLSEWRLTLQFPAYLSSLVWAAAALTWWSGPFSQDNDKPIRMFFELHVRGFVGCLVWRWQADESSVCLPLHLLRLFPAANKHLSNTNDSHPCSKHTPCYATTLARRFAFFFFCCDVRRQSTLWLALTVIGTSVSNQVFTFWQFFFCSRQTSCPAHAATSVVSSALAAGLAAFPHCSRSPFTARKSLPALPEHRLLS